MQPTAAHHLVPPTLANAYWQPFDEPLPRHRRTEPCCPILNKRKTFGRFPIGELAISGALDQAASFLSSSGHGGSFAFRIERVDMLRQRGRLSTRPSMRRSRHDREERWRSTVSRWASSSPRIAWPLPLSALGKIWLWADPLFLPCLLAHASTRGVAWKRYNTKLILGGEVFGEGFRSFAGRQLG